MTLAERELYVKIIKALYGNSVYVDESMISDEVAEIVDKILQEIRSCTVGLGIFIAIVQGVVDGLQNIGENIGFDIADDMLRDNEVNWVRKIASNFGSGFAYSFVDTWLSILMNDTQSLACKNAAALNWKSALAIALLGL
ncbi:hypothetical protein [Acinetobacter populi]|jgi:hypothetical protein|uniref:Uncharacterized protein n=1 Tax=Acinetobacter populi TaxID=1582270 RepID=A0A1Z9YWJ7_9GAMM|nr:hypothetical protein [Acinetobacter populi]MCH4248559.1 hypothetical protein [Acinetobacter populi]OUY06585.1 hypothetical protein CAP51_11685 [Acinetobacter populi]